MKNNKNYFLILVLCLGCSKPKAPPSLFSKLETKASSDEKILTRALAAAPANMCLKDIFSVELLKKEITELEKKYSAGPRVTGTWKHLKLADLSVPQATFLKKFGDKLGNLADGDAYDYTSCRDVPCLFNKIYEKEDSVAGYVHYLWYLRMGSYLAAVNMVYDNKEKPGFYNQKPFPVTAYLYRDRELFAFWRLSHMLKAPHTELSDFTEIYRVPQGESFDFVVERKKKDPGNKYETCGLAISNGVVILQDVCLQVSENWEGGNFYDSVLHEINHQLDYQQGRKIRKTYRSNEADYVNVSKFILDEYKDEAGVTIRQWKQLPGMMLVTAYAGGSPQENFAETLALFRVKGDFTKKKISQEHWDFVANNYYSQKAFDRKSLIDGWLGTESPLITQLAFKAVSDCTTMPKPLASTYFKASDFRSPVLPSMLDCLGSKAAEISVEVRSKIKVAEPDGCETLSEPSVRGFWEPGLRPLLAQTMGKYLQELQKDNAYFAKIQGFVEEIPKRQIANTAYLTCTEKGTEESCYDSLVTTLTLESLVPLQLPEEHAQDLAKMYLAAHPFAETSTFFSGYYRSFVSSNFEVVQTEAADLFGRCLALPLDDTLPPVGNYFSVGTSYMASSIYNCLNSEFPESVKTIVRNLAVDDMKIQHAKEEVILSNEVAPELRKSLEAYLADEKIKEAEAVTELLADENGQTRTQVLSDLSWVRDVFNAEAVKRDCLRAALSKIDIPLRYQTKMEAFGAVAEAACVNIDEAPQFKTKVEESKQQLGEKSLTGLETLVTSEARIRARKCLGKYPIKTNLDRLRYRVERETCLLNDWPAVEAAAAKKFAADPLVTKYGVDVAATKARLVTNRRKLQLRIIKESF